MLPSFAYGATRAQAGQKLNAIMIACGGSSPTGPSAPPIANYAGAWAGTYTVTGCTQSGGIAAANICGAIGASPPYSFSLTQSGSNVAGTFTLGSVTFPSTGGVVGSDGSLALNATSVSNGINVVVGWNLRMTGTVMSGTITQNWSAGGLTGSATIVGTIATANR